MRDSQWSSWKPSSRFCDGFSCELGLEFGVSKGPDGPVVRTATEKPKPPASAKLPREKLG